MAHVMFFIVLAVCFALWLLPVWLPAFASFLVRRRASCEIKWSLRAASLASLAIAVVAWRANRPLLETSEFAASGLDFVARTFAWTWAGGFACTIAALIVGAGVRLMRHRRSRQGSGEA